MSKGRLCLVFGRDAQGRSVLRDLYRQVPLIVQRALYFDEAWPELPCVYIQSAGGPMLQGDRFAEQFVVREGAFAHISTGAATLLSPMPQGEAHLWQHFVMEANSYLEYLPLPTLPGRQTRYLSCTLLDVHPTATLVYSEIFTSGRRYYGTGERFAYDWLDLRIQARNEHHKPLFRDRLWLCPSQQEVQAWGFLGPYDVFANVLLIAPQAVSCAVWTAYASSPASIGPDTCRALTRLPYRSGLLLRILGASTLDVKQCVRQYVSMVRMSARGHPLPPEFPWR